MTKETLQAKLDELIAQQECGMNLYFILHQQDEYILKKANVRYDAFDPIKEVLRENLIQLRQMMDEPTFAVLNLSGAEDRKNVIYQYDLDEELRPISLMKEVDANLFNDGYFTANNNRVFNFDTDNFEDVDAWIASYGVEGNHIIIYRKTFSVNLLKQGRNLFIFKDAEQIDIVKDDIFRIDGKIDFFLLDDTSLIYNISILEKFNDFKDIVQRSARSSIQQIAAVDLVEDIAKLRERAESDISFARKLIKVTTNALILNVVDKERIIQFAREHAYLSRKLKVSADNKFDLEKKSAQNLFIQLLDDAFLHSELSSNDYLSPGKDILRTEEAPEA
ncbi:MAG: DUF4868 domain-containing protein [Paludibacteraceae bacterium]|nr:DUF4868 domain-containing protein [Paludibacteraceae bacterium]